MAIRLMALFKLHLRHVTSSNVICSILQTTFKAPPEHPSVRRPLSPNVNVVDFFCCPAGDRRNHPTPNIEIREAAVGNQANARMNACTATSVRMFMQCSLSTTVNNTQDRAIYREARPMLTCTHACERAQSLHSYQCKDDVVVTKSGEPFALFQMLTRFAASDDTECLRACPLHVQHLCSSSYTTEL